MRVALPLYIYLYNKIHIIKNYRWLIRLKWITSSSNTVQMLRINSSLDFRFMEFKILANNIILLLES